MKVYTALGEVEIKPASRILSHEHITWWYEQPPDDEREALFKQMYEHYIPMYRELVEKYNCDTLIEHSPDFIDLEMAQKISRESGMNIVLATGCYIDGWLKGYRPDWFHQNSVEGVAEKFVRDLTVGMKGTNIKAAYIKSALAENILDVDKKLLEATALAQKKTGVSVSVHALNPETRLFALDTLENAGVPPHKVYINHADTRGSTEESLMLVKRGCNLNYTIWGINDFFRSFMPDITEDHSARLTVAMIEAGFIDRILFSVDYMISYDRKKGFDYFLYDVPSRNTLFNFTYVIPQLLKMGVGQEHIDHMMVNNPRGLLTRNS